MWRLWFWKHLPVTKKRTWQHHGPLVWCRLQMLDSAGWHGSTSPPRLRWRSARVRTMQKPAWAPSSQTSLSPARAHRYIDIIIEQRSDCFSHFTFSICKVYKKILPDAILFWLFGQGSHLLHFPRNRQFFSFSFFLHDLCLFVLKVTHRGFLFCIYRNFILFCWAD